MIFEQVSVGGDRNFAYIVGDETAGLAAVVDPSFSPEKIIARCGELDLKILYVVNTHDHFDHNNGNGCVTIDTGAKVVAHPLTTSICR